MAILLCDGKEFSVKKFVKESRMYTLDMSFESKKEFEEFSKLYFQKVFLILKLREKSLRVGLEICCMIKNTMLE